MKQASRAWNKKFEQFNGFSKGNADSCVCLQKDSDDFTIMVISLDDGVLCSTRQFRLYDIVIYLSDKFEITSGALYHFVGFEIARDRQKKMICISQQSYLKKILPRFEKRKTASTVSCSGGSMLSSRKGSFHHILGRRISIQGSSCHAMHSTKHILRGGTGHEFSSKPNHSHWEAVTRIFVLRYLKETIAIVVSYFGGKQNNLLCVFSDSDFSGDGDDQR